VVIVSRAISGMCHELMVCPRMANLMLLPSICSGAPTFRYSGISSSAPYPRSSRVAQSRSSAEPAWPPRAITFLSTSPIGVLRSSAPASISPRRRLDRLLTEGGYRCPPTSQVFRRAGLGPSLIQNTIQNSCDPTSDVRQISVI
jgi:hypothetical protein